MKLTKTLVATAMATLTLSQGVNAAAFQLSETSVSGLGRAYAGEAAVADNAAVVATNPALMTSIKRPTISAGAVLFAPDVNMRGNVHLINRNADNDNVAPNELVPQIYGVLPINDNFAIGGGVNVNYGLSTKYNPSFTAGFLGGETHLQAINANFSGAYRYNQWSFGLGANVVYTQAKLSRHLGSLPAVLGAAIPKAAAQEAYAKALKAGKTEAQAQMAAKMAEQTVAKITNSPAMKDLVNKNLQAEKLLAYVKGDDLSFGFNVGLAYEFSEDHRIGLAYHSPISVTFRGKYRNDLPSINGLLPGAIADSVAQMLEKKGIILTGGQSIDGELKITLPDFAQLAWTNRLNDQWTISYGMKWTNWSKFKKLQAFNRHSGGQLFYKNEGFKDSWRYALGLAYDLNDQWTLRTGVAYDTSAADAYHTISIPDTDRTWLTLGATYRVNKDLSLDMGYAYIHGKKSTFTEDKGEATASTFTSTAKAMLYGLNVNYQF